MADDYRPGLSQAHSAMLHAHIMRRLAGIGDNSSASASFKPKRPNLAGHSSPIDHILPWVYDVNTQINQRRDRVMLEDSGTKPFVMAPATGVLSRNQVSRQFCEGDARSFGPRISCILCKAGRHVLLASSFLAVVAISSEAADITGRRISLPIEIVGSDGTSVSRTAVVQSQQAESV